MRVPSRSRSTTPSRRKRWSDAGTTRAVVVLRGGSGTLALRDLRAFQRWETRFPGRCVGSFLALQGIDRATALSAQAFTALIPLLLVVSAISPSDSRELVSDAIIDKFALSGSAAEAVEELFARPG